MPREIDLKLESLLKEKAPGTTQAELAKRLGVSKGTLRGYMENRWTVLDRTVMERLTDFFQCDAAALMTTAESRFFAPFRTLVGNEKSPAVPICFYLRRPDANLMHTGRPVAHRDNRALQSISTLLRDCVDCMVDIETTAATREEFDQRLLQNCIVVGSPMVNPASEMAICRVFGVEPFNPGQSAAVPFAFRIPDTANIPPSSVLEMSRDGKLGIWLRHERELLETDSVPRDEFRRRRIKRGRDHALVVVSNQPLADQPGCFRKLVVLAGFGGVGTEEAAKALVESYRDLEPREDTAHTWGIIEVIYQKAADSTARDILDYHWRCRVGGRRPVDFAKKES